MLLRHAMVFKYATVWLNIQHIYNLSLLLSLCLFHNILNCGLLIAAKCGTIAPLGLKPRLWHDFGRSRPVKTITTDANTAKE